MILGGATHVIALVVLRPKNLLLIDRPGLAILTSDGLGEVLRLKSRVVAFEHGRESHDDMARDWMGERRDQNGMGFIASGRVQRMNGISRAP